MNKLYLSGPMTGLPDNNYPTFNEAASALRAHDYVVYNPAEWDEQHGGFDLADAFVDYCTWIIREADAVALLPGWEKSRGARAEAALAHAVGKRVVYAWSMIPAPECDQCASITSLRFACGAES